jgi:FkbM family methyltransferase
MQPFRSAARALIGLLPADLALPILSGRLRGARWVVRSTIAACWWGKYEQASQNALASVVRPGQTIYDIGANVGFYTLLASKLTGASGRVVAFEPLPRNIDLLRRHLRLNHISNVTIVEAAVAAGSGRVRFSRGWSHAEGFIDPSGELEVPTVSLAESLEGGLPPPDCIKMDIEGGEVAALTASREILERFHPTLLLSTHGYAKDLECCDLLKALGYEVKTLRDGAADGQYEQLAVHP